MTIREIVLYRVPQFITLNIAGRIYQHKDFKPDALNLIQSENSLYYENAPDHLQSLIYNGYGKIKVFDQTYDLRAIDNWNQDLKHAIVATDMYYANINRQDFIKYGDIKYVCELNRFYFMPFLALSVSSKKCESFTLINKILEEWKQQNPYLRSVNWTSGIEVGIRCINLVYAHRVLLHKKMLDDKIDKSIKQLILMHYHYLKRHLSKCSSANNHRIAELCGLLCVSSYFTSTELGRDVKRWSEYLFHEIDSQFYGDGVNKEMASHYHVEVLDQIFNALNFLRNTDVVIPDHIDQKVERMFEFVSHISYEGNTSIFGDNDNGYLLYPSFDSQFDVYDSLLKTSNYFYNTNFSTRDNKVDARNYLIFGDSVNKKPVRQADDIKDHIFEESGFAFAYDHKKKIKLSFKFGKLGDEISGAHGHSDIFHFNLEAWGIPVLIDGGTYQYHAKHAVWRSFFRSVAAHNTLSINGMDQATQISRMSWLKMPSVKTLHTQQNDDELFISATHDGFIEAGVNHERQFKFMKQLNRLEITDCIHKSNDTPVEVGFYLNFNPELPIEHSGKTITVQVLGNRIEIQNPYFDTGRIIQGRTHPPLGWYSRSYGQLEKGKLFHFKRKIGGSEKIKTVIVIHES